MNALLLLVHGSPREESNMDMFTVVEDIRKGGRWPLVEVGFLDCNQPDIPAAIDRCVELGATRIVGVPYFLHSGRHLTRDLPDLLEAGARKHPGTTILMGDTLGENAVITEIILDRRAEAKDVQAV